LLMGKSRFKNIVVTLDGPAASGKSTTALRAARQLGWTYLDTGAMYRALAVKTLQQGIALDDETVIGNLAGKIRMRMEQSEAGMRIFMDDEDVTDLIRTPEVDQAVGPVCEVPLVRQEMVRLQREMLQYGHLITDGRDMGTVVFPNADLKFYLTASIESRAKRRQIDMKKQGIRISLDQLKKEIQHRDDRDLNREHSPLRKASDAIELDTSNLSIDEQVAIVVARIDQLLHGISINRLSNNAFYRFLVCYLPKLYKALFGYQIKGVENVPMTGAVIVAPNHVSMMDPPIIAPGCPRELFFFAKQELFEIPILSNIIRTLNAFPVKRETGDRSAIRSAFQALSSKGALLLFPEGTRSKNGRIQAAKNGIGMIAHRNRVNIIPVCVEGTYKAWRFMFMRRIRVQFGEPISISPFLNSAQPKKEIYRQIGMLTIQRIKELQNDCHN
jgi:cytidylate kinase